METPDSPRWHENWPIGVMMLLSMTVGGLEGGGGTEERILKPFRMAAVWKLYMQDTIHRRYLVGVGHRIHQPVEGAVGVVTPAVGGGIFNHAHRLPCPLYPVPPSPAQPDFAPYLIISIYTKSSLVTFYSVSSLISSIDPPFYLEQIFVSIEFRHSSRTYETDLLRGHCWNG